VNRKIPDAAFQYFVSLGDARTHEAVAAHYGATRRGGAESGQQGTLERRAWRRSRRQLRSASTPSLWATWRR